MPRYLFRLLFIQYESYINTSNPDVSGMLRFLTDELQAAEDAGQRVWILGHVLPGWDGTSALLNGPNLLYQIIDRFSPHVIANVFMGHIHDEVRYIYYANNGTVMDSTTALTTTWVGGSITPLSGLNSGFSMYEVDPVTFDIMEAYTWFADVNDFDTLDKQTEVGPAYHFEYSTRETYTVGFDWPETAPLNATFWHLVTESFLENSTLVDIWTLNQGRQSALTKNCTSTECQEAKVCYIRSGSPPIAAACSKGFGSVQE
jgi:sphingomyelin phosphodiesterase